MHASRRSWWTLYGLGVLATVAALGWISSAVLDLGARERAARLEQGRQQAIRLALWRMDSWLGPQLAVEVARMPGEYQAYTPQAVAYTKVMNQIRPGEVLVPSPLLTFESEIIRLHFEIDEGGNWTSPQIPVSNFLDLAEASGCIVQPTLDLRRKHLDEFRQAIGYAQLLERLEAAEKNFDRLFLANDEVPESAEAVQVAAVDGALDNRLNVRERGWRAQLTQQAQVLVAADDSPANDLNGGPGKGPEGPQAVSSSPLVPLWIEVLGRDPMLCFVRRVRTVNGPVIQGFLADWAHLHRSLVRLVEDLLPAAELLPQPNVDPRADQEGRLLATIPSTLVAGAISVPVNPNWTPAEITLLFGWLVALAALGVVGFSLRSSIEYGEQRSRFASTVTHELRTPLTTFRLYSEMLATGLVPEEKRQEYLETLKQESDRLSTLVENVLSYSRLEQGRASLHRRSVTVASILECAGPSLERRALEAGVGLKVRPCEFAEVVLETDPEAVAQILFNLVDNACKYGRREGAGEIELLVDRSGRAIEIRVRDHGQGVPAGVGQTIFNAFDRGQLDQKSPNPGIGLGLALSRGLARDLGGDLVLEETPGGQGASFCLHLPVAPGATKEAGSGAR